MYKNKRILGIIPARSGSKGIINKNIQLLNGKHLIGYTIEAANNSKVFEDVILSTDSKEYAAIGNIYGAKTPFMRETELAGDKATTESVIIDCITKLQDMGKEYDYFVLLQPTSPLRTAEDIKKAVNILIEENLDSVVSVCEPRHSPLLCNTLPENNSMYNFIDTTKNIRRQDMKKFYQINGAIYASSISNYINKKSFYVEKSKAYIMPEARSIDIDTILDMKFAEELIKLEKV